MKTFFNHKNTIRIVLAVSFIAVISALCLLALFTIGFNKKPIPQNLGEVTSAVTSNDTDSPDHISVPEETEAETTTPPEDTTEPVTSTEPEKTEPVTTTEPEPEPEPEPEVVNENEYIGAVYLTFDDGPSSLTPKYLDVLKEYGVNATFFVVGVADGEEWKFDTMKRALEEGNRIALHGYSHDYAQIYKSVDTATNNFYKENQQLLDALGVDIRTIRFPGGSSNTVSKNYCKNVMTDSAKILTDGGYNYFDWNVSSSDAGRALNSSEDIYNNVIDGVSPSRTNVVLMHDSGGHQATLDALPQIIEWLLNEGYELKVITDETPSVRHPINN